MRKLSLTTRLRRAVDDAGLGPALPAGRRARDRPGDRGRRGVSFAGTSRPAGSSPPGEFIPLAEELGLIEAIGDWVIGELARQAGRVAGRRDRADARVQRLASRAVVDAPPRSEILGKLKARGVDPRTVVVEITESTAMTDPERTQRILTELHDGGLLLALDDFGTGYSSLSRLKHLPVDILKIDRSFVSHVDERRRQREHGARDDRPRGEPRDARRSPRGSRRRPSSRSSSSTGAGSVRGILLGRPMPAAELPAFVAGRYAPRGSSPRGPRSAGGRSLPLPGDASATTRPRSSRSGSSGGRPEGLYRASEDPDDPRPRFYALDMFPYPSGDLHMGHAEAFAAGTRSRGSGGCRGTTCCTRSGGTRSGCRRRTPRSSGAIHPKEWTYANIEQQRRSFRRLGMSFDWTRQLHTCDPEYYRWTQWLFKRLFERGPRLPEERAGQLVPEGPDGAGERAGGQRRVRAVRHAGRPQGPDAVVLQDHRLRPAAARRHGGAATGPNASSRCSGTGSAAPRAPRSSSRSPRPATASTCSPRGRTRCGASRSSCSPPEHPLVPKLAEAGGTAVGGGRRCSTACSRRRSPNREQAETPRGRAARRPRREPGERREGPGASSRRTC